MEQRKFELDGTTHVMLSEPSPFSTLFYTPSACYLRTVTGVCAKLTHEGKRGWRLQANAQEDVTFSFLGASQALAKYLGEDASSHPEALTVTVLTDTLILSHKDGTSAEISLTGALSVRFRAASGDVKNELRDLHVENGEFVMCGALERKEAVFGGGERFDTVNQRGKRFELYSCDGWNNTSTTYAPIPVFFTSRGGGFFVNLYDTAIVDFGKSIPNRWSYTVKREVMDCYFYPSEHPASVLYGYTELSGHAYMPTPWMQGMHVCRYGPDFQTFETDFKKDTPEEYEDTDALYIPSADGYIPYDEASAEEKRDAKLFHLRAENGSYPLAYVRDDEGKCYRKGPKNSPGGNSVKTIMSKFIEADIKPDAASMENFAWWKVFDPVDDPARPGKAMLGRATAWLHAHGLRAMTYIACGRVALNHKDFKEEYLVHADVSFKNADGSVTVHENTVEIPWVLGTGENPDVWRNSDGRYRAEKYLDITNDEAVEWYFDNMWRELVELGVDGVKIDFCEELPDHGKPCGTGVTHYRWKDPSKIVLGTEHHAYPAFLISAFYRRMLKHKERMGLCDGFMVFSRGGGIGSQRNPYMWAGDQARKFEKLRDQLLAVVNSGLSGIPFMSYDMAGYQYWGESYHTIGKEKESEIFARAVEFSALTTNMQTHGDVRHAYEMTEEVQGIYRNYTRLHTELIPYIQKYSAIACATGLPPVRHPVLKHLKDARVYALNDEFMLGDALLVAPILTEGTFEREVYLPAGRWCELLTGKILEGRKTVTAAATLGQLPLFLDLDSPDAAELLPIFKGLTWNEIKRAR